MDISFPTPPPFQVFLNLCATGKIKLHFVCTNNKKKVCRFTIDTGQKECLETHLKEMREERKIAEISVSYRGEGDLGCPPPP